jgi:hypothetical protein
MQKIMLEKRQKNLNHTISKSFRNHKRNQPASNNDEDGKESRRSSDDLSSIYDEVFVSGYDKKKLLDEYISSRQDG